MLGAKIASLRKSTGMTQSQLGDALNVSAQAVSKWENDMAEPDIATIKKLAGIFNVTLDSLLEDDSDVAAKPDAVAEALADQTNVVATAVTDKMDAIAPELADKVATAVTSATPQTIGFCVSCGCMVNESNVGLKTPKLLCTTCHSRIEVEDAKRTQDAQKARAFEVSGSKRTRKRAIGWGIFGALVMLAGTIAGTVLTADGNVGNTIAKVAGIILLTYAAFAFAFELRADEGPVTDIMEWCIERPIRFPGIIFSADLDGCLGFIALRILFAILGFILGVLFFFFGVAIGLVQAPFTFPFALHNVNKEIRDTARKPISVKKDDRIE